VYYAPAPAYYGPSVVLDVGPSYYRGHHVYRSWHGGHRGWRDHHR
jgi:hypothetical protein